MNKKRILSFILSILLIASLLTSCDDGPGGVVQTTGPSMQEKDPVDAARDFAERLQNALSKEVFADVAFKVREKHVYSASSTMEKALFAKWRSDFSDADNPRFYYSMQRNPSAETPELLLFYDKGYFYVKDSHMQYRRPTAPDKAQNNIPFNGLTALLGEAPASAFSEADLTKNEDGTVTATVTRPLFNEAETVTAYLKLFGIEASGHEYGMDGDPCEIVISVCMDESRLVSYTVETVMAGRDRHGEIYPVTYTVNAVYSEIGNDFSLDLPEEEARVDYMEAEPEITEITAEEFLIRFEKSDERSNQAVYTEMVTNSTATYEFSESYWVRIPILNVTAIDLSKPRAPKISVVETKLDAMGLMHKKETYYKDDTYYYGEGEHRFSMHYPADEYLANVEASAKEKEEAGITSFFLSADMLKHATLTVNPDQSVSAYMPFDGTAQEKNIFYHVKSIYNDDLATMNAKLLSCELAVTLDIFNYLRAYTLTVTTAVDSNGVTAQVTYTIQYHFDYSETPREIDFPDDLDEWTSSSEAI